VFNNVFIIWSHKLPKPGFKFIEEILPKIKRLSKESFKEGLEYHAEIYKHKGKTRLTEVRKGTPHEVRALPHRSLIKLKKEGAVKLGAVHTHPKTTSEASFRDEMSYLFSEGIENPFASYDIIIGAKDQSIRIRSIKPKQRVEKWYEKMTNLSYRFMTGTYTESRAFPMFERYREKHGYKIEETIIPLIGKSKVKRDWSKEVFQI